MNKPVHHLVHVALSVAGLFLGTGVNARFARAENARACSFRLPLCVTAAKGAPVRNVLPTLAAAEHAWDTLRTLQLPEPLPSLDDGKLTLLLEADAKTPALRILNVASDPRSNLARSSLQLGLQPEPPFCPADRRDTISDGAALEALALASVSQYAGNWSGQTARALAEVLTKDALPCGVSRPVAEVVERAARRPTAGALGPQALGGYPFFAFVDAHYGAVPKEFAKTLVALGATPNAEARPDAFDILSRNFPNRSGTEPYLEHAIARYLCASKATQGGSQASEPLCQSPIEPAWTIDWPIAPRRLQSPLPVEPFGASYILIRNPEHRAALRVELEWESYAWMRWAVVRLDAKMREKSRIIVNSPDRAREAAQSIRELQDTDSVLLVGTALGDPTMKFYAGAGLTEGHAYLVTLADEQ
jgi:hypothetical protein